MSTSASMNAYEKAVQTLIENESHESLARVVVNALATAWALPEWDSGTIEHVLEHLDEARHPNLPLRGDDPAWQKIALDGGIYGEYDFD